MKIVLISGKQGSGKSSLQRELIKEHKRAQFTDAIAVNFADALYCLHDSVLDTFEAKYEVPRTLKKDGVLLQLLGTEWGRKVYGDNIWVNLVKQQVDKIYLIDYAHEKNTLVVIADCRFRNEFDAFPDALRVRLSAPISERIARTESWRDNINHLSEIDLDGYEIANRFDLHLYTGLYKGASAASIADLVLAQLQKNSWKEKRHD